MRIFIYCFVILVLISCKSKIIETPENQIDNKVVTETPVAISETTKSSKLDYEVKAEDLKKTISYLASDELNGRDTGSEGIEMAAKYLIDNLTSFGLKPYFSTYRDNFKVGELDAFNVVATIEGNDPVLKNEYIVIGAHYDHIGIIKPEGGDKIANGANDNASGTATILELARYFGSKKSNKRSILFAFFSAEEKGLQGSRHLAKRLKENNLDMYSMLNFEMTGVPFVGRDYMAFVTGYDLTNLADIMNAYAGKKLIGKSEVAVQYNLFKRSDNYAFYQEFKMPSQTVSSCDLTNFDHYHKVGDEAGLMDYTHMANLTSAMVPIIEKIANSKEKEIVMNE